MSLSRSDSARSGRTSFDSFRGSARRSAPSFSSGDEGEYEENYPQAPHREQSSKKSSKKRAALGSGHLPRKVNVQYDLSSSSSKNPTRRRRVSKQSSLSVTILTFQSLLPHSGCHSGHVHNHKYKSLILKSLTLNSHEAMFPIARHSEPRFHKPKFPKPKPKSQNEMSIQRP